MQYHFTVYEISCLFVIRPDRQNLFPIVQGGLDADKRRECARELVQREVPGFAVGGLSGGEEKEQFWRMVHTSTDVLPRDKPRYLMGVGFAVDLVVCSALGVDMYDCVFPTRLVSNKNYCYLDHSKKIIFGLQNSPLWQRSHFEASW